MSQDAINISLIHPFRRLSSPSASRVIHSVHRSLPSSVPFTPFTPAARGEDGKESEPYARESLSSLVGLWCSLLMPFVPHSSLPVIRHSPPPSVRSSHLTRRMRDERPSEVK